MASIHSLWAMLQTHTDQIRNLRGRLDSISSGSAVISPGGSSVLLSDANPLPVAAAASPGVGSTSSRFDHVHVGGTSSGQYRQFVYEVSGGTFTFLTDPDGYPIMTLLDLE